MRNDRVLWAALFVGLLLRVVPLAVFPQMDCIRDECIYRMIAADLLTQVQCLDEQASEDEETAPEGGESATSVFGPVCVARTVTGTLTGDVVLGTSKKGWLPSPGFPYLMAWCKALFGSFQGVKGVNAVLSILSLGLMYTIGREVADLRTARIAAWLMALNPTIAWFSNTMWIETVYIFLLLAAILAMLHAVRTGRWQSGAWSGAMLGGAVLFRGVATYLPPFWILAALYPDRPLSLDAWTQNARQRWRTVAAFLVAMVVVVAPYSIRASTLQGGFLVTDATVGHVMYLGNNDYPPLTFDYGNGMLTEPIFNRYLSQGRKPCDRDVPPVQSSKCEVDRSLAWMRANPGEFLRRIPLRLAQMMNPNSFLTRHVRWGYWPGFPWWAKEALCITIVLFSAALTLVGTAGAWARGRGPFAMMAVGTTLYTMFTISLMYGMTRFRLPLEALWTVYLAVVLAHPSEALVALRDHPWRLGGAILTVPPLVALMWWFLPSGFPSFW